MPAEARGSAVFVSRGTGVLSGVPIVALLASRFGLEKGFSARLADGDHLAKGSVIAHVAGPMHSILAMERTALNFLQRLAGIASFTARFVERVAATKAGILDTRKTTPGWRVLEKYAVRCGGGLNHRMGLHDAILIKGQPPRLARARVRPDRTGHFHRTPIRA